MESDDFMDQYDRNGLNFLFYWKAKYPEFKITLFAVPGRLSDQMMRLLLPHTDWIELAVHGFKHESNFECYGWDYDKANSLLERAEIQNVVSGTTGEKIAFKKIFKAPGWSITPGTNGYPSGDNDLINSDVQAVYKALRDRDYVIFDRDYNSKVRPEGCKVVCMECNPHIIHTHTWDTPGPAPERNGFVRVEEDHGVPWDENTVFHFVSEAWDQGLFKECIHAKS